MTLPPPNQPQQVWDEVLTQLRLQMTRQTFDAWLNHTSPVSADDGIYVISVANEYARDWLENRLHGTVLRTLINVIGCPVQLKFIVAEQSPSPNGANPCPNNGHRPKRTVSQPGRSTLELSAGEAPVESSTTGSLAVDIRDLNRTGYQPLTNYYPLYIEPYLDRRWSAAGQKAYALWEILVALDGQWVTNPDFCNWSRPVTYQLKDLADLLDEVSIQELTGRYGYCWQVNEARKENRQLTECCGVYQPDCDFQGVQCKHWRPGILEVLSAEGILSVEEMGGRKNYRLKLQIWHSWPILTPIQAQYLSPAKQKKHQLWLQKYQHVTGLSPERWAAETDETAIEQFTDRQVGRECYAPFQRNPFWPAKSGGKST